MAVAPGVLGHIDDAFHPLATGQAAFLLGADGLVGVLAVDVQEGPGRFVLLEDGVELDLEHLALRQIELVAAGVGAPGRGGTYLRRYGTL